MFFLEAFKLSDGMWLLWVYYAGFAPDAVKYTCTIKVHHQNPKTAAVTYLGDVIPMTIDHATIKKERMGLTLSKYVVTQLFWDNAIRCSAEVSKK
jgi:hypothetical protein